MVEKLRSILLLAILLVSTLFLMRPSIVKADAGKAKVYVVCLPDAGSWWVDNK